jgi:uncharacterized membrane protein YphA (DoxX/SURF4 family)
MDYFTLVRRNKLIKFTSLDNKYIYLILRIILGVTFIWASVDKILNPAEFAKLVYNYRILPDYTINIFGIVLPWIEFLCGIFLVVGFNTKSSSLILSALLLIFIIAISAAIFRDLDINCGCFSTDPTESSKVDYFLLLRDIIMLFMGAYLIICSNDFLSLQKKMKCL